MNNCGEFIKDITDQAEGLPNICTYIIDKFFFTNISIIYVITKVLRKKFVFLWLDDIKNMYYYL